MDKKEVVYTHTHTHTMDYYSAIKKNTFESVLMRWIKTSVLQKHQSVLDVTCDGSKVLCCKEQYCIGTWNIRSMNQGKLKVVKQELARVTF